MELNDNTDYQRCFACGQQNPYGLHMVFRLEDGMIVSDFVPQAEHQGFPGVIHGGIVAAIMDEALNRTSMLADTPAWTMTGRLTVRYRRYVPYGPLLRVRAWLGKQRGRMIQATGTLAVADEEQAVLAEAEGTFMAVPPDLAEKLMQNYPRMLHFFE
jgi:acyl-coenzyme A thioesterase PaaI-like protein